MQDSLTARRAGWLILIVSALFICTIGCAVRKPPSQNDIVGKALPAGTQIPPTWSASSSAGEVSNDWLKTFQDPQLDAIVAEAIANNLDLRQAAQRVEEARQTVIIVGAQLKPQIGGTVGGAHTTTSSKTYFSDAEYAALSWEIDIWGKLRAQRAAAMEGYEATALSYAFARQSLAATAADSWYLAVETRQLLALAQDDVGIYAKLLELSKARRAAGKVSDLDVAEANASLDASQSALRQAQSLYSDARRNLEVLIGRYPAAEIEIAPTFSPLPPPVQPGLPSSLLERRPDIIAAERQVQAAFHTQEAARLSLYPSFLIGAAGGNLSDLLLALQGSSLLHTALGMTVPVYQGGSLRAQLRVATAQQEQAVAYYGGVSLRAFKEVEIALTNEELLTQRLPFEKTAVQSRSEAVRLGKIQYRYGSADMFLVLQLQSQQITQQSDLIRLYYALLGNRVNLHLALGGGFDAAPATATALSPP
ncbi:MAG: efflux transporter outer membrane subunit [Candidatus Korobacteraceae bacterium]